MAKQINSHFYDYTGTETDYIRVLEHLGYCDKRKHHYYKTQCLECGSMAEHPSYRIMKTTSAKCTCHRMRQAKIESAKRKQKWTKPEVSEMLTKAWV